MRITLLTNEYPPHVYGGAGVHVEYLSQGLANLEGGKHEIHILCFGDQKEHSANKMVEGIQGTFDFPFQDSRHQKLLETLFQNLIMTGSLREIDIVHCHTWYTHLAGSLIKEIYNVPLVITTHSLEPHRPWKEEQLGSAYQVTTWLEKTAYQNADGVIAVSQPMKRGVHDLYKVPFKKIRIIPNGIDTNQYRPTPNPALLRSYKINPDQPFLLFVGRISRQKGIIHLVNAIKYLSPGIQVVLCAGAPDTEEIDREMVERVRKARTETPNDILWIPQWVSKSHLISLYSHASVFVCPSVYEPFGIVNLEAMACGTPVVASAVGGIPEVVVPGETGLLVSFEPIDFNHWEPRDPEQFSKDLATTINSLFLPPERIRGMGLKARERVEKQFSWKSIAQQTLAFYRELTGKT
ncbi:MAG: glycogen synthase [Thermodesulfobacteriota bacterium]